MFTIDAITLYQFRNYQSRQFHFDKRIVTISGPNGSGKTNLLDAIYICCLTKSHFSKTDKQNVTHGKEGYRIQNHFTRKDEKNELTYVVRENGKKELQVNGEVYSRLAQHIGYMPIVMIAPDDIAIITGGSEQRRKEFDMLLSQIYPEYLQHLLNYNRILLQRNKYLKDFYGQIDFNLLDIYDNQLTAPGNIIHHYRQAFFESFIPSILEQYNSIADRDEKITIHYQSMLNQKSLLALLQENRQRDIVLQRTSQGIHKDDIEIQKNDFPFKNEASQGQRKSLLFAIKLAAYRFLEKEMNLTPILLLDDIFEKLDQNRMHNLLKKICLYSNGQIFITDTHSDRIKKVLNDLKTDFQELNLEE